jgi:putative nucleotidyltransferase with HDIG domain
MDSDATDDIITVVPRRETEPDPPRRVGRWSSSRVRRIAPVSRSHAARLVLFTLIVMLVSVSTVAFGWSRSQVELQDGDIATETLKAPETVEFESELRTAERRQEAYSDERNIVQTYDQSVRTTALTDLQAFLARAETIRGDATKTTPARAADLRAIREDLDETAAETIVGLPQASWERVKREADRLVDSTLSVQVRADEIARIKEDLSGRVSAQMTSSEQAASIAIATSFIGPNVFVDDAQTLTNRQKAAAAVDPVIITVQAGQAVVRDGDPVTKYDIEKLQHLGLLTSKIDVASRLGKAGLMAVLTIGLTFYLYAFNRRLWQGRQIILVALIVLGPIVAGRLILPSADIQYMFPAAASAMLFAILVDFQFAAVMSAVLALYLGVVAGMSFELAFVYFVASVTGAFLVWGADRTVTFVWAGFGVALSSFAVAICFEALAGSIHSSTIGSLAIQTIMAGVLSAAVTFLSFSLLGSLFGITTHLQLLELAHPNQPLLYRLAREAPGTYHHSIVVSNLAETGAEIIGGDPLFARVAVLYHDVGKIMRPSFFIENQANRENPHDQLDPRTSARVIVDHVHDGVRLARKARLPQPIIDIIEQHHGTTLIRYFFARALESDPDVAESEFRYPGPRPQTKEAGVIMLADSVEAAVRSAATSGRLFEPSAAGDHGVLEAIVRSVVQERLDDGQLDECDITLRDVEAIRQSFVQLLLGIYHPRVEYPALRPRTAVAAATTVGD